MMLTVQVRMATTTGRGVGRWRTFFLADDLIEAEFAARNLVPKALVRVVDGRQEVVGACYAEDFSEHARFQGDPRSALRRKHERGE